MAKQLDMSKGPGVYVPPPLFYVLTFFVAVLIQKRIPIDDAFFHVKAIKAAGVIFLIIALFFLLRSLRQFFLTKNTIILIRPASSLQTTGIYAITRNPMYVGLAILYLGVTCFIGNWWNLILLPFLILIVQEYIIKREEKYLELEFGSEYEAYKNKVRRWL
jgi:protein-S-isoprenylcysteine O-methyltransferase Ste14